MDGSTVNDSDDWIEYSSRDDPEICTEIEYVPNDRGACSDTQRVRDEVGLLELQLKVPGTNTLLPTTDPLLFTADNDIVTSCVGRLDSVNDINLY